MKYGTSRLGLGGMTAADADLAVVAVAFALDLSTENFRGLTMMRYISRNNSLGLEK